MAEVTPVNLSASAEEIGNLFTNGCSWTMCVLRAVRSVVNCISQSYQQYYYVMLRGATRNLNREDD